MKRDRHKRAAKGRSRSRGKPAGRATPDDPKKPSVVERTEPALKFYAAYLVLFMRLMALAAQALDLPWPDAWPHGDDA